MISTVLSPQRELRSNEEDKVELQTRVKQNYIINDDTVKHEYRSSSPLAV